MAIGNMNKEVRVLDNGGETFDRYTAVYLKRRHASTNTYDSRGMSANLFHPQVVGQYSECSAVWAMKYDDKVIPYNRLSADFQRLVLSGLGLTS